MTIKDDLSKSAMANRSSCSKQRGRRTVNSPVGAMKGVDLIVDLTWRSC